jgi:pantothenate kinase
MAEEEREQQQQTAKQAAKAAKRQRQKERQRQQAVAVAGEAGRGAEPAAAVIPVVAATEFDATAQVAANSAVSAEGGSLQDSSIGSSNMSRKKQKGKRQLGVGQEASGVIAASETEQSHHHPEASAATAEACSHHSENNEAELAELLQLLGVQDAALQHYTSAASQPAVASQPAPHSFPDSTLSGLLSDLLCPITQEPMRDPVVAADGRTYERTAIEGGWRHGCRCKGGMLLLLGHPGAWLIASMHLPS